MRPVFPVLLISLLIFIPTLTSFASPTDVPKLKEKVKIDGILDDTVWQKAAVVDLRYITWPQENLTPDVTTQARYFEDGETLYIAFEAQDPDTSQIRAYYNDRDEISRDDLVGVKLDPYNDHRLVYQFFANPLGVQLDKTENVIRESESSAWDGIWDSAGQVTDDGFTVEMAIPLRNFNFNSTSEVQTWAVEFLRFYPRNERQRISNMKIDKNNDCWACQMQEIKGFKGAKQGQSVELTPTLVAGRNENRFFSGVDENGPLFSPWESENDHEFGLNVKWGISPDVFLNATVNPDFSQVEADAAQIGINKNFTLFFSEKRPFFLENQDSFNTNFDLVYTRNIGAPDVGLKLTGKTEKHTFGVFAADDDNTTFLVPGNLGSGIAQLQQSSKNAALRYRYDADKDLSVGVLSTFRTSDNYHNYVNSFDLSYKFTEQDNIRIQAVHSDTKYPDWLSDSFCGANECPGEEIDCEFNNCIVNEQVIRTRAKNDISDQAYRVRYEHNEKNWYAWLDYKKVGQDFRADLGFESRTDYTEFNGGGVLKWYGDKDTWWTESESWLAYQVLHNDAGELIEKMIRFGAGAEGPLQSWIEAGCRIHEQVGNRINASSLDIDGNTILFARDTCHVYGYFQPVPGLFAEADLYIGKHIDFANNREADRLVSRPGFAWSINAHLKAELNYYYEELKADSAKVFTVNQADLRIRYNLNQRNSLRLSVIYTDIDLNTANQPAFAPGSFSSSSSTDVSTQLIYSYKINPQTVFFAGYSDHSFKNDLITSYEKDDRNIFVKFSYAWLL